MAPSESSIVLIIFAVVGAIYCTYEIWSGFENKRMRLIMWAKSEASKKESSSKFYVYAGFNILMLTSCLFYLFA